jgi:hypothetical protein
MKGISKFVGSAAVIAAFMFTAGQVSAVNLIQNPGFETGDLTSWLPLNTSAQATITVQSGDNGPSAPGSFNAFLNNQVPAGPLALQQTTAPASVGAGVLVSYSFDLKGGVSANGGVFFVHIFDQNSGGGVISQGPGLLGPYFPSTSAWTTITGSFTTVANTDHLTIEFDPSTGASAGSVEQMHVDNVALNIPGVPEPTTVTLVGLGLLGTIALGRKRS